RALEDVDDLFCDAAQLVEVVAKYLDDQLAMRAGDLVVNPIDHRLAEAYIESWHRAKPRGHARDQLLFGFAGWPSGIGVKADACFDMRRCPGIGTVIVSPQLSYGVGYLGELADGFPQVGRHFGRLAKRDAGWQLHLEPDRALIEFWQEL